MNMQIIVLGAKVHLKQLQFTSKLHFRIGSQI